MSDFPAITLWQPWASLVAAGVKPFEFRSWPAPRALIGRRVAIHAGARKVSIREIQYLHHRVDNADPTTGLLPHARVVLAAMILEPHLIPRSSVVCLATLGEPIRDAALAKQLGIASPVNDSDRMEHSNWGWPLTDVEALEPFVPARGALGWWTWTRTDE